MDSSLEVTLPPPRTARERRTHLLHLLLRREEDDLPTGPGGWIVPQARAAQGLLRRYQHVA